MEKIQALENDDEEESKWAAGDADQEAEGDDDVQEVAPEDIGIEGDPEDDPNGGDDSDPGSAPRRSAGRGHSGGYPSKMFQW